MKKLTISKLQKKLWENCKRLIRARYALKSPQNALQAWECYTCGKVITDKENAHTGHFIPKSVCGAFLKYDLRNLRVQCMACNVWRGGMGAEYYRKMVEREGQEYVDQLFLDKQKSVKAYDRYAEQLAEYEKLVA